jgi:hypothetical protein
LGALYVAHTRLRQDSDKQLYDAEARWLYARSWIRFYISHGMLGIGLMIHRKLPSPPYHFPYIPMPPHLVVSRTDWLQAIDFHNIPNRIPGPNIYLPQPPHKLDYILNCQRLFRQLDRTLRNKCRTHALFFQSLDPVDFNRIYNFTRENHQHFR